MSTLTITDVTPANVLKETLFCIADPSKPGFENKRQWFVQRYEEGLRLKILKDAEGKRMAFIEYIPAEFAWRPVEAPGLMFIHCMFVYANQDKGKGNGSLLLHDCAKDAMARKMRGIAVMTSKGAWIAGKRLFEKNGFVEVDRRGRFELMVRKFDDCAPDPRLIDWTAKQQQYQGWHLLYADQCPWHEKSARALKESAAAHGIELHVHKIGSSREAREAPSGYGVYSLMRDGRLLEDHYISQTRFENILKKELGAG